MSLPLEIARDNLSVRNENGLFINTNYFREEALHFMQHGYYCPDPVGTRSHAEYWQEQFRRCKEGYSVGGVKITGAHYGYMNFAQIKMIKDSHKLKPGEMSRKEREEIKKTVSFPSFWDGDYNYFWCLDIARNGIDVQDYENLRLHTRIHPDFLDGQRHMLVGKARRKGYSYKNGWLAADIYNTIPDSYTMIGAFDKKYLYPKGTMQMASDYLNFLNENTAFKKKRLIDRVDNKKSGYTKRINGIDVEKGYKSEIMALTFKDNPDAPRGKDPYLVLLEEAGAFPNMIASWKALLPAVGSGIFTTGLMVGFGTGGDMEKGTVDFAKMMYSPHAFKILPFINIWDNDAENTVCGFFHPNSWNMDGFYDQDGNSDIEGAKQWNMDEIEELSKHVDTAAELQQHVQEFAEKPEEAFLNVSINDFPVRELRAQLNLVKREKLHKKFGQAVYMKYDKQGKVKVTPDLKNELFPIFELNHKDANKTGAPVIYEYPVSNPPKGLYKIGFDPYRQTNGESLASIYVYKCQRVGDLTKNIIVAQYIGRPYDPNIVSDIAILFAELYNAEIMYENEVSHVKSYFERKKKLHLFAGQPDRVISKNVQNSRVARVYGCHMNTQLKEAGCKYIKSWLMEIQDYDENGDAVRNLDKIYDPGFLEELIGYNDKGNFDRVMSFMMVMFQVQEDEEGKIYDENPNNGTANQLLELMKTQFQK